MTIGDVIVTTGKMLGNHHQMYRSLDEAYTTINVVYNLLKFDNYDDKMLFVLSEALAEIKTAIEFECELNKDTADIQYGLMYEFEEYSDTETEENDG